MDDFERVLHGARAGEEGAAAVLFDALHPRLLRYLRWAEPHAAEDLAAETWLAVAERIGTFEGDEVSLRAWVFSIARRRLADHRRKAARRKTYAVPDEELQHLASNIDTAEVAIQGLSAQQAVAVLASFLRPEQAEVIVLRVLTGLEVEEVARIMGKRPGTVRVLQHRALRRLAESDIARDL